MPKEAAKFGLIRTVWKTIMNKVEADPLIVNVDKISGLFNELKNSHISLEEIQKGLNDYLEKKRLYFPRFFFLPNEDLLNILAETRDPLLV